MDFSMPAPNLLYLLFNFTNMDNVKEGKKDPTEKNDDSNDSRLKNEEGALDGKRLYDLYRHTTKLID